MATRTFTGATMNEAMREVTATLGGDALIAGSRRRSGYVEIEVMVPEGSAAVTAPAGASAGQNPSGTGGVHAADIRAPAPDPFDAILNGIRGEDLAALANAVDRSSLDTTGPGPADPAAVVADDLPPCIDPRDLLHGVVALVGPAGGGKTTTLAKIATRQVLQFGTEALSIVGFDRYRMGAQDYLTRLGRLLGVDMQQVYGADLGATVMRAQSRRLVLVDTPGLSLRDERLDHELKALERADAEARRILVLPANLQRGVIEATVDRFNAPGLVGVILTRLDETLEARTVLDVLRDRALPVAFLSDGPDVPEDFHIARPDTLARFAKEGLLDLTVRSPRATGASRQRDTGPAAAWPHGATTSSGQPGKNPLQTFSAAGR